MDMEVSLLVFACELLVDLVEQVVDLVGLGCNLAVCACRGGPGLVRVISKDVGTLEPRFGLGDFLDCLDDFGLVKPFPVTLSPELDVLDEFRKIVTDEMTGQGYTCIGISPYSMAFRGNNRNVSVTISELGKFRAVIRLTRKKDGIRRAFETGSAVSAENARRLVQTINSL